MPIDHIHALPPGTRFEEYRLDAVLGAGGFGITYRAYDANLDKFVAIKEYLPGEFATRTAASTVVPHSNTDAQDYHWGLTRFLDEARTLARFDHPHLNKVHRFFESNGTAYMVLEYIQGETLADRLSREPHLEEDALQRLLDEVLSGLAVMHEAGYVHRDIKPDNLMLREEDGSAVVLDFGAARQAVGQRSKPITSILTPGYAPIEQYDSKADDVGPWSDIYALGMVAYRCISGLGDSELPDAVARMLAHTKGGTTLLPAVEAGKGRYSPKLLEAIDWAMAVDEEARPQSVDAWRQALAGGSRRKSSPKSVRKPAAQPARGTTTARTGMSWSSIALTLVIVALVGAGGWWGWQTYPELFGQGGGDTSKMAEQGVPADMPGETPQETETRETGKALASTEQTPPPVNQAIEQSTSKEPALSAEEAEVVRLLAAAEADLKARRLTSPVGNNAWEKYQQVLRLSPAHLEATAGVERLIGSYMELFGAAVEQEEFEQAATYLSRIRDLHPDSPALLTGQKQLEDAKRARAARLAEIERQRQAEEAARQAELERQRIAQEIKGHWESFEAALEAENLDEAADNLAQVRALDPEESGLAAGEQRLETGRQMLLERQRQAALVREAIGEMVSIPGGTFRMGDSRLRAPDQEKPAHSVTVPESKMGKYEVTFAQWEACVADGGCGRYTPDDEGWGRGNRPVMNVSWNDIQGFIRWLNNRTGGNFRLPTEAEWEFAARAGSSTQYHYGNNETYWGFHESQLCRYGNHADTSTYLYTHNKSCSDGVGKRTAAVGRYQPNSYGLYDMYGNVADVVQDCWNDSYKRAPTDGSAWTQGDCGVSVIRGGSWSDGARSLRSASRWLSPRAYGYNYVGFRLAQDK